MCTIQKYNLLAILATCVLASPAAAADGDSSRAVMEHWVGTWKGEVAGDSAETAARIAAMPDHAEVAWTLGDKFIQGTNSDAASKPVGIWMMRYDADDEEYKVYFFSADGSFGEWDGTWSEADQTMTWEGEDEETGAELSGYTKFVDGRQEWKLDIEKNDKITSLTGTLTKVSE